MQHIRSIYTHRGPHPDEAFTLKLLWDYGKQYLAPDVRNDLDAFLKLIEFVDSGSPSPNNPAGQPDAEYWFQRGIWQIGVGGGRFDEHPQRGGEQRKKSCAAVLMAEFLGVADKPELKLLLGYVQGNDQTGSGSARDCAAIMRKENISFVHGTLPFIRHLLHLRKYQEQVNEYYRDTLRMMFDIFEKDIEEESLCLKAIEEFEAMPDMIAEKVPKVSHVSLSNGAAAQIATMITSNPCMKRALSGYLVTIFQDRTTGQTQVFLNKKERSRVQPGIPEKISLDRAAILLNLLEQAMRDGIKTTDLDQLRSESGIEGGCWYYVYDMLMNGSLTAWNVEGTALSLDLIIEAVFVALNPAYLSLELKRWLVGMYGELPEIFRA